MSRDNDLARVDMIEKRLAGPGGFTYKPDTEWLCARLREAWEQEDDVLRLLRLLEAKS